MAGIAKFYKVSFKQFQEACQSLEIEHAQQWYEQIKIPQRATKHSAGYDFFTPFPFRLHPQESIQIPTGIRVQIKEDWVLQLFPRSGLGFQYRLQLNNTVGIVDADYFYADNEGHIFAKITNDSKDGKIVDLQGQDRFMQGVFLPYGLCDEDEVEAKRIGGLGSTK